MKLNEKQLNAIIESYKKLNDLCDKAREIGLLDFNGQLQEAIWDYSETLLDTIDPHGWIIWYVYENDYGNNCYKVTIGINEYKVCDVKTLLEVMNP